MFQETQEFNYDLLPIVIIVIGVIIFVIAFFGCCGAIRESTCMLTTVSALKLELIIIDWKVIFYSYLKIGFMKKI